MASTQKKTVNTKKQTTGKKPNGTRKKPPAYVPDLMARGIGAAVCLFLALMVVLGMVGIHAVVPICCAAASAASLAMAFG